MCARRRRKGCRNLDQRAKTAQTDSERNAINQVYLIKPLEYVEVFMRFLIVKHPSASGFIILDMQTHKFALSDPTNPDVDTLESFSEHVNGMPVDEVLEDWFG